MINVVMITRDRLKLLEQSIESLYQHTPFDEFNLTIVDDCSTDFRISRLLYKYGLSNNCSIIEIRDESHVVAHLKNIGVAWSTMTFGTPKWLYLSDNDVYFTLGWSQKLIEFARDLEFSGFKLFGGQVHPFHKHIDPLEFEFNVLDGPSWLMRWETWKDYGPLYGNAPGACQSEDAEFCSRLRMTGCRIGVIQPHVVYHVGLTHIDGSPAPGADIRRELLKDKRVYKE